MSFEIKYTRDGVAIKQPEPEFVEVVPAVEIPSPEAMVENQTETEPEVVENQGNNVVEETPVTPIAKPVDKEINWKKIRDEKVAAEKRIRDLEAALAEKQSVKEIEPDEDLSFNLDEDALAEGKHLKQVDKRFQKMQKELDQYKQQVQLAQQQSVQQALKDKLKEQYPDWDQVYNKENIARLEVQEPEIYEALNASTDVYRAGVSAYKMIKQMVFSEPAVDVYAADKARAQTNASKPKSLASISPQQGDSPLSKANAFANGLTEDLKKNYWKEMNDARKGY